MPSPSPTAERRPQLVLASSSPRRRALLVDAGLDPLVIHPGIEDGDLRPGDVTPSEWTAALAYLKAAAGAGVWTTGRSHARRVYVLGADTLCVQDGRLIGKPRDASHAREIIEGFVDTTHEVITGVALIDSETRERSIFSRSASVAWGPVERSTIDRYIENGGWRGKAGAYNLTERVEAGWPIVVQGDPNTVVGLPVDDVTRQLLRLVLAPSAG